MILTLLTFSLSTLACADSSDITASTTKVLNVYGEDMELKFELWDPGTEDVIDYEKYGEFLDLGTGKYRYKIKNRKGLSEAVGEGVYPSNSVYRDPAYKKIQSSGKLRGLHWDFTSIDNYQLAFYKWATAPEAASVKQFFTAVILHKAKFYTHAIKAYHAVAVHFPKQAGWTVWHTPIYYGQKAMDKVEFITRTHPELGLKYVDFEFEVEHGDNLVVSDDKYTKLHPGRLVPLNGAKEKPVDLAKLKATRRAGSDHVELVQFDNGHWQLRVDGEPFMVKAIAYEPTPVGQSAHDGTREDWMNADLNNNGRIDGPYDSWVDHNKNEEQDPDEPVVGDFQLLKEMGANALRHYHGASNKELLREAYEQYGLMAIIGDLMGMYAAGSGADWYEGTDYTNPEHLAAMRERRFRRGSGIAF